MSKKAAFHTLGCKVNAYETEAMAERLREAGYTIVPFEPGADVYIVNTCTVTGIADRKSRQMLHRAKEMNPGAVVAAVGCYAEDAKEKLLADPCVDLVIGNSAKSGIAAFLDAALLKEDVPEPCGAPIAGASVYDESGISETAERTRAFIKIQDGCNQFCSYCMIPYVRGRVRSRSPEAVTKECARLTEAGFREIVLTGIHISSYGLDFDHPGENRRTPPASEAETNRRLLGLIREAASVPGISRVRLGSLEPGIMTGEFIEELAAIPAICPQFHLSLQSGCDGTLERMKRRYNTEDYRQICARIRERYPDAALTTDIIVGFPGETGEEFETTLRFAEEIRFARIHVFKYSRRAGTAAASMAGQVPETVKKERSAALIALEEKLRREYAARFVGRSVEVLIEEPGDTPGTWRGKTREAVETVVLSGESLEGKIVTCTPESVAEDASLLAGREILIESVGDTE